MRETFVTTLDNPFNFFTQFDDWYAFDTQMGYNTCGYVDRIAKTSNDMSEHDRIRAINDAVDEIVMMNLTGNYTRVVKESKDEDEEVPENMKKMDENKESDMEKAWNGAI